MAGKRALAARLLDRSGALRPLAALRGRLSRRVTILAYHRVLDVGDEDAFPFDVELVSASVQAFADQMEYVRAHFRPVRFADLLDVLDRGERPAPGTVVVTFDDGFADNYHNAFPVLERLRVPATIFLSTGYIDDQSLFWFDKLGHAILTTGARALEVRGLSAFRIEDGIDARRGVLKEILTRLKRIPDAERVAALDEIFSRLGMDGGPARDERSRPMTWQQVREMSEAGIEFGSHSVTHPVLSMLDADKLRRELEDSKRRIEAMIAKPVEVFAYPVGGREAFDERVRAAVKAAGYRLGVTYVSGVEDARAWDPYALRRVHVERYVDGPGFRAMMAAPRLFVPAG